MENSEMKTDTEARPLAVPPPPTGSLLPCPFCGAADPAFRGVHDCHYIQCEGCGASGPDCDDQDEAERTWNLRANKPLSEP